MPGLNGRLKQVTDITSVWARRRKGWLSLQTAHPGGVGTAVRDTGRSRYRQISDPARGTLIIWCNTQSEQQPVIQKSGGNSMYNATETYHLLHGLAAVHLRLSLDKQRKGAYILIRHHIAFMQVLQCHWKETGYSCEIL
jgi:hypothetical protein